MRFTLEVQRAEVAADELEAKADRFTGETEVLLSAVGNLWLQEFKAHLRRGEALPGVTWPHRHWLTHKIRRHYKHEGKPKLERGGTLLNSLTTLEQSGRHIVVGTRWEGAATLQHGGTTLLHGTPRPVQAFPFVHLHPALVEETTAEVRDFFLGEA